MVQYQLVEISEDVQVQIDVSPGAPTLGGLTVDFRAETEDQLRDMVHKLGFDPLKMNTRNTLHVRYGVPVTRDGEKVGDATVNLWLGDELAGARAVDPPIPALERLRGEARRVGEAPREAPMPIVRAPGTGV